MPKFGTRSLQNLKEAHPDLQNLFNHVILKIDCSVLEGSRGRHEQEYALEHGFSHAAFGASAHNYVPALGVDVVPYPIDWTNTAVFKHLSDVVKETAEELGLAIDWGGDWHSIKDMPHYELRNWQKMVKAGKAKLYED